MGLSGGYGDSITKITDDTETLGRGGGEYEDRISGSASLQTQTQLCVQLQLKQLNGSVYICWARGRWPKDVGELFRAGRSVDLPGDGMQI